MKITYLDSLEGVSAEMLAGFFVGWPNPPSPETHLHLLQGSSAMILAVDEDEGRVVGFITALSDGVLTAFIPLLEVLPTYEGQGIGRHLVERMLARLKHLYSIDLVCDEELIDFYEGLGFQRGRAMLRRNYPNQAGMV